MALRSRKATEGWCDRESGLKNEDHSPSCTLSCRRLLFKNRSIVMWGLVALVVVGYVIVKVAPHCYRWYNWWRNLQGS